MPMASAASPLLRPVAVRTKAMSGLGPLAVPQSDAGAEGAPETEAKIFKVHQEQ